MSEPLGKNIWARSNRDEHAAYYIFILVELFKVMHSEHCSVHLHLGNFVVNTRHLNSQFLISNKKYIIHQMSEEWLKIINTTHLKVNNNLLLIEHNTTKFCMHSIFTKNYQFKWRTQNNKLFCTLYKLKLLNKDYYVEHNIYIYS